MLGEEQQSALDEKVGEAIAAAVAAQADSSLIFAHNYNVRILARVQIAALNNDNLQTILPLEDVERVACAVDGCDKFALTRAKYCS